MRTLWCLLAVCVQGYSFSALFSAATPFNVSQVLELLGWESITPVFASCPDDIAKLEGEVVLDYLYEEGLSRLARGIREQGNYYRMWGEENSFQYAQVFSNYVKALNWSRVLLIGDTEKRNSNLVEFLATTFPSLFGDFAIVPRDLNLDFVLQFVGRQIKSRGLNLLALFLNPLDTLHFLQALESKKMNKVGYAYALSQDSGRYRFLSNFNSGLLGSGVLIVGEDSETESSVERAEAKRLRKTLECIATRTPSQSNWSLFFTKNLGLVKAASAPSDVNSKTVILFPGNTTAFPRLTEAQIVASVNYQLANPDGSQLTAAAQIMRGFQIAFEEANNRTDLLPFYTLEDRSVDFTSVLFNYNYSLARVKAARNSLGLIYMPFPTSQMVRGMTKVFTSLNITMPITTSSADSRLSDPKVYPFYVRTRPAENYICAIIARMIKYFGWTKIAFLYGEDGTDTYQSFLAVKDIFGITITNPESTRMLPLLLDNSTIGLLNVSLQAIIASQTRIIVIAHNYMYIIMEQLYDLGVREGYVQIFTFGMSDTIFKDPQYYKRRIVSKGALQFFPRMFVGKVGQHVRQMLMKRDSLSFYPNTCLYYDSAYLYFHATDYLIDQGYDYEDPYEIMRAMRDTHFHGCSGFVKIERDSNDRAAAEIVITNFQYDSENDVYQIKEVGSFNPFSLQPYNITSALQWPDNQPTYADSKPLYLDCPFLQELVRELARGKLIGLIVDFAIASMTLVVVMLIWRRWWQVKMPLLAKKEPIMIEDVLVLSTVVMDYFQLAAVGPELSYLSHLVTKLSAAFGCDLQKFINITNGVYWVALNCVLVFVVIWTLVCILKLTRLDEKLLKGCGAFEYWSELLMPTLGHLLFLPIVSTLSSVYLCYKGTSESLKDSFLNKDCYEYCWRSGHIGYAVGSGIGLLCYIPLAVFTRPLWQELQPNVHVKAQPLGLMIKSAVQVFLIVLSNTLKRDDPSLHAYLYFTVISVYALSMLLRRQYNYDRLNLWQVLMMIALLSLTVSAHLSTLFPSVYFVDALAAEYSVLGCVGVGLQFFVPRFASRLTRARSRDVRGLFQFAFTFGQRAQEGLDQFYQSNQLTVIKKTSEPTQVIG